jgi:hypothetical protein
MRLTGSFSLHVESGSDAHPPRVSIVLTTGGAPDARGLLPITPDCMTLDELEGCINALQDELDVLRADARRAFTVRAGHG